MNRKQIFTLGVGAMLSLGLIGGAATMAAAEDRSAGHDATEVQEAGSIAAAIKAAETQSGGKALGAQYEDDGKDAGWYSVRIVMADGAISEYLVNLVDGTVKAAPAHDADSHKFDYDEDHGKNGRN